MVRSRTISVTVEKKTGDAFDAILNIPPKMMPDAKMTILVGGHLLDLMENPC